MVARIINILLGIWLFISSFIWPHHPDQVINSWACGLLTVGLAWIAISAPSARFLSAAIAIWIFFSGWIVPATNMATVWNDLATGFLIFFFAMIPNAARNESGIPPKQRRVVA